VQPLSARPRRSSPLARCAHASAAAGALLVLGLATACGASGWASGAGHAGAGSSGVGTGTAAAGPRLADWPEFGLDPQRSDATNAATGITAGNVGHLRHLRVELPGTVDSSPIYLHGALVGGASHNVAVVTTSYGRTIALDADTGRILWTFTPPGFSTWAGGAQLTNASPVADPGEPFVYAPAPDGRIHKLSLADGREVRAGGWPVSVTRDPTHEKLGSALGIDGPDVIAVTGGYYGDAPPYQGHVVAIDRASGRVRAVFNTLCSNRRRLIVPSSCPASDSAIWSRAGAVVEPGGGRLLVATGNGPWNGVTDFGDSVLELGFPSLRLRQAFTPSDQAHLNTSDTDLGSGGPAYLGSGRALIGGKDGILRVLDLHRLDGRARSPHNRPGGEVQQLSTPGGAQLFTAPCVWRHGSRTTVFVADSSGTAAYALRAGRLHLLWENGEAGTSPVFAGGLLYVYNPGGGGIAVYRSSSPHAIAHLAGSPGHWNSPIVVDGHVIEPSGNADDHSLHSTLDVFLAR
jgi:hypothetical protein